MDTLIVSDRELASRRGAASSRGALLDLLAELWFNPIEERQLPALRTLSDLCPGATALDDLGSGHLESLRRAFDRHLRIPGPSAFLPYETSHLPPAARVAGPQRMAQIAGIYRQAGYDMEPFSQYPAAHLGHELRFLAALCHCEAEAIAKQDEQAAENVRRWQIGFLRDHLQSWIDRFRNHVERVHADPVYDALVAVAVAVVANLSSILDEP